MSHTVQWKHGLGVSCICHIHEDDCGSEYILVYAEVYVWRDPLDKHRNCQRKQPAKISGGRGRQKHPGPAGCAGEGGGSRWCREVSGSGREDERHLSNSTPVRCQSRTGSKRPFIPQPCTIDLFIRAPSLSLTISASHSFTPVALLPALLLCLTPHSYCVLSLLLSPAVLLSL